MSNRVRLLLVLSLAANLFLGGVVVAGATRWLADRDGSLMIDTAPAQRPDELTQARRRELNRVILTAAREGRPHWRELRAARREAAALFAANPYDPAAVAAQLRRARLLELDLRGRTEAAVVGYGSGLSAEERAAVAPLLERGLRPRRSGEGRRRGGERR